MKASLALSVLLLFASAAQAQQHAHQVSMEGGQGYSYGYGGGAGEVGGGSTVHTRAVYYEAPRIFVVGYAKNDGEFVPSTFMNYDDAVALGQQQLAAADRAARGEGTSLGELARNYRTAKVPTLKLQTRVQQDDAGRLEVCNLNGNNCHRP